MMSIEVSLSEVQNHKEMDHICSAGSVTANWYIYTSECFVKNTEPFETMNTQNNMLEAIWYGTMHLHFIFSNLQYQF